VSYVNNTGVSEPVLIMSRLKFRIATTPASENDPWDASIFSPTQNYLPGLPHLEQMDEVTYPRFVNVHDDLLFTYRIGE
jgi:hypothetical protein